MRTTTLRRLGATVVSGALLAAAVPSTPAAAAQPADRSERVVEVDGSLRISEVTWRSPLPPGLPAHPAACDQLSYLRYRTVGSPDDPAQADAVVSLQPGATGGAASLDNLARNTLRLLAAEGRQVEVWAMDRRGNCVEDRHGIEAAIAARDHRLALDYYWGGKTVAGKRFGGFLSNAEQRLLVDFGVKRTVDDWHFVHTHELPDAVVRQEKLVIGGHSLGSILASFYAAWDFDGNAATVTDAGYKQIAGYVGLDGPLGTDPLLVQAIPGVAEEAAAVGTMSYEGVNLLLRLGLLPRSAIEGPLGDAQNLTLLNTAGVAARFAPEAESDIPRRIPRTAGFNLVLRLVFSQTWANFLTGWPDFRNSRLTNEAVLGALQDDNSFPTVLHSSFGTFGGGPVAEKHVPLDTQLNDIPGVGLVARVLSPRPRVLPTDQSRLYGWRNYDELSAPLWFTSPDEEVSDIADVARVVGSGHINFTEEYWPTRQATDVLYAYLGTRTGDLRQLVHDDFPGQVPGVWVVSENLWAQFADLGIGHGPEPVVVAPGYGHNDIITAAAVQNDGEPEIVSTTVAAFVTEVLL